MTPYVLLGLLVGAFVGLIVGALTGNVAGAVVYCGLIGCLGGWVLHLNVRLKDLESPEGTSGRSPRPTSTKVPAASAPAAKAPGGSTAGAVAAGQEATASPREQRSRDPVDDPAWTPGAPRSQPETATAPAAVNRAIAVAKDWFTAGNVPVKVGVVVLLFGVGFFINYAIDRQLFTFPVWARLAAVAAFGIVMLGFGWRLRRVRKIYALSLQGGGLGILYLTTYAAFEFYALLPASVAFAAMVVVTLATGALALSQDSRVLIVLGVAGGFLAPLLVATETGSHVVLFSYYAVLNVAILTVAWFKAWRILNLLGFAFTFVIGSFWGYQAYRPEHFSTTEPFLVLFVVMYIGIAFLFALRQPPNLRGFVDSALVFGAPFVGFALQTRLVESDAGLAWTAAGLTAVYTILGAVLWRIKDLRLLASSFIGLAVFFLTVAFPLALDDRLTGAAWAAQGATLAWFGVRYGSRLLPLAGAVLQVAAGVAHVLAGLTALGDTPLLNGVFLGGVLLALGGWTVAWALEHAAIEPRVRVALAQLAFGWAAAWWFFSGFMEIRQFAEVGGYGLWLGFAAASAILAVVVARLLAWQRFDYVAFALLPAMVVGLLVSVGLGAQTHPFQEFGWLAWPVALGVQVALLRYLEPSYPGFMPPAHVGTYWLLAVLLAMEAHWLTGTVGRGDWPMSAAVASSVLLTLAAVAMQKRLAWPGDLHGRVYSMVAIPVVAGTAGLFAVASLMSAGSSDPLPYLPLANPTTMAVAVAAVGIWFAIGTVGHRCGARVIAPLFALAALVALSSEVARGAHHFAGVPFTLSALGASAVCQAGLSLVWGAAGLAGMVVGAARARREIWIGGAVVMGIVIAKLFMVELGNVGTLSRVVSFLGVGMLLLIVGYVAPVPKSRTDRNEPSARETALPPTDT